MFVSPPLIYPSLNEISEVDLYKKGGRRFKGQTTKLNLSRKFEEQIVKNIFLQTAFCLRSSLTRFSFCYSKLLFLCELLSLGSCIFYPYQCFYSENIFAIQFYLDIFFEDVCLITLMLWRLIQNLPRIVITMGTHTWTKIYWHLWPIL